MLTQMYGWWGLLLATPPAAGLGSWLWLSPTAHRVLSRVNPGCRAEHRLASLRLNGRISAADYQRAMANLAHQPSRQPSPHPLQYLA